MTQSASDDAASAERPQRDVEKIGVVLVHGLGDCQPGDVLSETVQALSAPDRHTELRPDEHARVFEWADDENRESVWDFHQQRSQIDGRTVLFSEVFWSDLKKDSRLGVPAVFRFIAVLLKSHYILKAISRGNIAIFSYLLLGLIKSLARWLRVPILGLNAVFGAVFISLSTRMELYCGSPPATHLNDKLKNVLGNSGLLGDDYANKNVVPYDRFCGTNLPKGSAFNTWYNHDLWLAWPILIVLVLGVTLIWITRRYRSFWFDAGVTLLFTAAVTTIMLAAWRDFNPGGAQVEFFTLGIAALWLVWVFFALLVAIAGALLVLGSPFYMFTQRLRSEIRGLLLAFSIVSIQAVVWAIITRPMWISGQDGLNMLTDFTFLNSDGFLGNIGSQIDRTISVNLERTLYLVMSVFLIFLVVMLIVAGIRRFSAFLARQYPKHVHGWYPRVLFNVPGLLTLTLLYAAGSLFVILFLIFELLSGYQASTDTKTTTGIQAYIDTLNMYFDTLNAYIGIQTYIDTLDANIGTLDNAFRVATMILLLITPVALALANRQIEYAGFVLEDIANYNRDAKDRAFLLERDDIYRSKSGTPFALRPIWRQVMSRLDRIQHHLLEKDKVDRLLIVAHSQGTIVLYDYLERLLHDAGKRGVQVDVITLGSPLQHIYARYFPEYFDMDDRIRALRAQVRSWTNMYRINEAIGTTLLAKPDEKIVREVKLPPGPHKFYWSDPDVGAEVIARLKD